MYKTERKCTKHKDKLYKTERKCTKQKENVQNRTTNVQNRKKMYKT